MRPVGEQVVLVDTIKVANRVVIPEGHSTQVHGVTVGFDSEVSYKIDYKRAYYWVKPEDIRSKVRPKVSEVPPKFCPLSRTECREDCAFWDTNLGCLQAEWDRTNITTSRLVTSSILMILKNLPMALPELPRKLLSPFRRLLGRHFPKMLEQGQVDE